jgi:Putative quorum-sensing-regulated virulence factor
MNNYSAYKLWWVGSELKKQSNKKPWFEITSSDEWDEFVEKHEITNMQIGIIKQGFSGVPLANPEHEAETIMPFGVHKDKYMKNLPMDYLLYLRKQDWLPKWPTVASWLARNKEKLDKEEAETDTALDDLKQLGEALKGNY